MEFTTSLIREKFVLSEKPQTTNDDPTNLVALSNRIQIDFPGKTPESFVIRAHNMHICVRLVVRLIQNFKRLGAIMSRPNPHDWDADWDIVLNDYERFYNPDVWGAIYFEGKIVFETGEHHPLLDLIEKCAHESEGTYDEAVPVAESVFKASGKNIKIEYDSNVALVLDISQDQCRCGIIHRSPNQTTTFSYGVQALDDKNSINVPQVISGAAAYLEGIQLAFMVGMNNVKMAMGIIERFSYDEKKTREAKKRLSRINTEIANMEAMHTIRYRPERPDFTAITHEAEELANATLEPPPPKPVLTEEELEEIRESLRDEESGKMFD